MAKTVPKCSECEDKKFSKSNGGPHRYYCLNPIACKNANAGAVKISNCDRGSTTLKTKTSPRWCPKREV